MNLWLRLIWTCLMGLVGKRMKLFGKSSLRMTVLPTDIDLNLHLTNARYLAMADLGRVDFIIRTGLAAAAIKMKARPIVGESMAKFRKDLRPFQRFDVVTELMGWDDKWAYVIHRFCRHGRVAGVVIVRCLFANAKGAVPPADVLLAANCWQESPEIPAWARAWSVACDALSTDIRQDEAMNRPLQNPPSLA